MAVTALEGQIKGCRDGGNFKINYKEESKLFPCISRLGERGLTEE